MTLTYLWAPKKFIDNIIFYLINLYYLYQVIINLSKFIAGIFCNSLKNSDLDDNRAQYEYCTTW